MDLNTRYIIKFRAWNRDNGDLYEWDMFENYPLKGVNATYPQESTGFYDKNFKMIYVGDIVHYCQENYLVRFRDGGYILYKIEKQSGNNFFWFYSVSKHQNDMEIVGNTFKNADYLSECIKID